MAIVIHKNIVDAELHVPKGFASANNGDYSWKNELGELEYNDELVLPAALNFVDASLAPPTESTGDVYVLSLGGSVHADWDSVSLKDWVRYDGTTWNSVTPQKASLCYDKTTDFLQYYDGSVWASMKGGISNVTSAEKAALTPSTGEFVYDTDLDSFQRYNGSSWVDVAKGYGLVSVSQSLGQPVFYTDLATAYAAASSGDLVKLHSDLTENGDVEITLTAGVVLDLNGFTYTLNTTGNSHVFRTSANSGTFTIKNGTVLKIGGGTGYVLDITGTLPVLKFTHTTFNSSTGRCLLTSGQLTAFGSRFYGTSSGNGNVISGTTGSYCVGGEFYNLGTGGNDCYNSQMSYSRWESVSGTACNVTGSASFCSFYSDSGDALNAVSGAVISHCYAESNTGYGTRASSTTTVIEHLFSKSGSSIGIYAKGIKSLRHSTGISGGGSVGISAASETSFCYSESESGGGMDTSFHDVTVDNCTVRVNTGSGAGINNNGFRNKIYNCTIEVASTSAYGIMQYAADCYYVGNKIKGTVAGTRGYFITTGDNLWTDTADAQGNSANL